MHIHNAWSKRISVVWHLDTYERIWNFPWLELFIVPKRKRSYLMSFLAKKASLILLFTSKYFTVSRSGKFWRVRTKIANLLSNTASIFCTIFYKKLVKLSVYFKKVYKGGFAGSWWMIGRLLIKILLLYIDWVYILLIFFPFYQWFCCL